MSKKHLLVIALLAVIIGCAGKKEEYVGGGDEGTVTEERYGTGYPVLQEDASFEGIIETQGNFTIKGRVKGTIIAIGTIFVDRTGYVECDSVVAGDIIVDGFIKGKVKAFGKIQVDTTGVVVGNTFCKNLIVNGGAIFHGPAEMAGYKREREMEKAAEKRAKRK